MTTVMIMPLKKLMQSFCKAPCTSPPPKVCDTSLPLQKPSGILAQQWKELLFFLLLPLIGFWNMNRNDLERMMPAGWLQMENVEEEEFISPTSEISQQEVCSLVISMSSLSLWTTSNLSYFTFNHENLNHRAIICDILYIKFPLLWAHLTFSAFAPVSLIPSSRGQWYAYTQRCFWKTL